MKAENNHEAYIVADDTLNTVISFKGILHYCDSDYRHTFISDDEFLISVLEDIEEENQS